MAVCSGVFTSSKVYGGYKLEDAELRMKDPSSTNFSIIS